ncbi:mismatch repair endonuclease PMS2 [Anopheles cruzii]|uniref:mismatch repair endonuclease PMS2 n=1 Tax=Anopheles cruzii TaxID=68878 RepID=UPI0022EC498E|nr:mismatch repair endonuclease PMS2 [Anopheles cruzii]
MSDETDTPALPATTAESRKINAIDKETVHKICSGQVVLSLAIAVKELVENSLDAGATLIEVKLREQGADLVEVADNGSGVEEKNFEGLTAKYHTSKLKEFTDLESIETFGFRGEALSSLCALSDMVITTRHSTAHHATKLTLNNDGRIQTRSPCARPVGTTVTLSNLFATLPVRKKEFQRNIKREFLRMCQILQAYCLVSVRVRIICTNQSAKGAKTIFMSTDGADSVLDNIRALFGPQQTGELLELKQAIGSNGKIQDLDESDLGDGLALTQEEVDNFNLSQYTIEGYISSCAHGAGRSTKDRQFYYVNSRPCEPRQISKLVNDAYHRFNVHQHPFIFLNLKLGRTEVDVNVTPDKRMVMMNNEKIILLAVRKSIKKTFGSVPSSFKMQNLNLSDSSRLLNVSVPSEDEESTGDRTAVDGCTDGEMQFTFEVPKASSSGTGLKRKRNGTGNGLQKIVDFLEANKPPSDSVTEQDESSNDEYEKVRSVKLIKSEDNPYDLTILRTDEPLLEDPPSEKESVRVIRCTQSRPISQERFAEPIAKEATSSALEPEMASGMLAPPSCSPGRLASGEQLSVKMESSSSDKVPAKRELIEQAHINSDETIEIDEPDPPEQPDDRGEGVRNRNHHRLQLTMDSLEDLIKREQELQSKQIIKRQHALTHLKFKSKINPTSNKAAENELQTEIAKSDFAAMQIVGQFNLGFIVCRLADDLFIVDQHATDEKYNFEDLQQTTVIQNQRLMVPQTVELTAVNEMILIDNLDVFEMNGFKFEIDGAAPTTRKVRLIAKPYSRNWEFGKEDIDELIFMLQDAPGTVCRPSRVRAMFASRACRKSVMMGTALSVNQMLRLVRHMGEIEQPWNCPHGRPTMRHLVNLAMIHREPEK